LASAFSFCGRAAFRIFLTLCNVGSRGRGQMKPPPGGESGRAVGWRIGPEFGGTPPLAIYCAGLAVRCLRDFADGQKVTKDVPKTIVDSE
jgi:hypothetical protein